MKEMTVSAVKSEKKLHFEVMRLIAIFFVIHTHTEYNGYFLFSKYAENDIRFWVYLVISVFGAVAVPLFFSISGALMLNRPEEPLKRLWIKRVARYAILTVAACFLYYFQRNGFNPAEINLKEFMIVLYSYSSGGITWFLYSYLAYLILLPVLRTLAQNLKDIHFYYLFAIALIYNGMIPVLEYVVFQGTQTINPSFAIGWATEKIVIYPLLGYFLEHRCTRGGDMRRFTGYLWIANVLTIGLSCVMTAYKGHIMGGYWEGVSSEFFSASVLTNCAAMYLTVSGIVKKAKVPDWLQKGICSMGQCTLGIYIFHLFIMELPFSEKVRVSILSTGMDAMLASLLFCLYVLLISYGMTFVFRKIPGVKKLL